MVKKININGDKMENQNKKDKKNSIIETIKQKELGFTILSTFAILIILISSSYAVFTSTQKAKKINNINVGNLQIEFVDTDNGNAINLNGAYPQSDEEGMKESPYTFKIKNTGSITTSFTIKLQDDTDVINEDNCSNNQLDKTKIKYSINDESPVLLSSIEDKSYLISSGSLASGESKTYSLRVWIDESAGNEDLGKHYHGKIILEGINAMETPSTPQLVGDMIPVTYDEEKSSWVKTNTLDETWYNYEEQRWANAVTVTNSSREKYKTAKNGTTISMDDINTMWVWIPRYSYTIGNTYGYQIENSNTPSQTTPGGIDIKWIKSNDIDKESATYTQQEADNYYTPQAFCFGNTCDSSRTDTQNKEVSGIWVSKFELTGSINSITVKPSEKSVSNNNVSTFYTSIKNQLNGSNASSVYGLSGTYDTHMIKNSEWAAVAYLSQSKYGKYGNSNYQNEDKEIMANNCSNYITGIGADNINSDASTTTCTTNTYETKKGQAASTTGNITGIYDMSGGSWEYVMGNIGSNIGNSGFTTLPEDKYLNKLSSTDPLTACNNTTCKGQALNEVTGWYNDITNLSIFPSSYWIFRGRNAGHTSNEIGIFSYQAINGENAGDSSTRMVIVP